jgi:hypothetical protein
MAVDRVAVVRRMEAEGHEINEEIARMRAFLRRTAERDLADDLANAEATSSPYYKELWLARAAQKRAFIEKMSEPIDVNASPEMLALRRLAGIPVDPPEPS